MTPEPTESTAPVVPVPASNPAENTPVVAPLPLTAGAPRQRFYFKLLLRPRWNKPNLQRQHLYEFYELLRGHLPTLLAVIENGEPGKPLIQPKYCRISAGQFKTLCAFVRENLADIQDAHSTNDWKEMESFILGSSAGRTTSSEFQAMRKRLAHLDRRKDSVTPSEPGGEPPTPSLAEEPLGVPGEEVAAGNTQSEPAPETEIQEEPPVSLPPPVQPDPTQGIEPVLPMPMPPTMTTNTPAITPQAISDALPEPESFAPEPTPAVELAPAETVPSSPRGTAPDRLLSLADVKRVHEQIEYWVRLGMAADKVLSEEGIRRLLVEEPGPKSCSN
jgi:hypothetical protein